MATIGILHPGAMGAAMAAVLCGAGHDVLWASAGRSPATADRARDTGAVDVGTPDALREQAEVTLSICPPHAALDVAEAMTGFDGIYVDANAIAPGTAHAVATRASDGGATYVDGGIIGAPPTADGNTRLYLSGEHAPDIAALFDATAVDARVLDAGPFAASALKMAFAAWSKGTAALLLAIEATADHHDVAGALHAEWRDTQPDVPARVERAQRSAAAKGWRWVGEMEEIARAFAAAGQPAGFHAAAAEIFGRYPRT